MLYFNALVPHMLCDLAESVSSSSSDEEPSPLRPEEYGEEPSRPKAHGYGPYDGEGRTAAKGKYNASSSAAPCGKGTCMKGKAKGEGKYNACMKGKAKGKGKCKGKHKECELCGFQGDGVCLTQQHSWDAGVYLCQPCFESSLWSKHPFEESDEDESDDHQPEIPPTSIIDDTNDDRQQPGGSSSATLQPGPPLVMVPPAWAQILFGEKPMVLRP
jgi:hypothetical protein